MAMPMLRRPKFMDKSQETDEKPMSVNVYVILTLKDETKLVISSDAYNGILTEEEMFRCVFCDDLIEPNSDCKETHKISQKHKKIMKDVPYVEEFAASLIRKLNRDQSYCTVCNVVLPSHSVVRHMSTDVHTQEMSKAVSRALIYKPNNLI